MRVSLKFIFLLLYNFDKKTEKYEKNFDQLKKNSTFWSDVLK